jgi:cell division protein FtsW
MKNIDKNILLITGILIGIGLIMVYSTSAFTSLRAKEVSTFLLRKQLVPLGIGGILLLCIININYHFWGKCSYLILAITIVLLLAVLILGPSVHGVKRWLRLGNFSLQVSEIAKLGVIIFIADFASRQDIRDFKHGLLPILLPIVVVFVLIAMEPSFGVLSVICIVSFILLFWGGAKIWHLSAFIIGIIGGGWLFMQQFPYAKARILSFFAEEGYQLRQSIYGIGCGGIFGKGLGNGREKLLFLPEAHTDFIFSIIGEELGFIGCIGVLALFSYLLMRGINVGIRSQDRFGFLLASGISLSIFISACFHIGVTCGILPTTGLPLPFISFGRTNLLINIIGIGILLNISKNPKP